MSNIKSLSISIIKNIIAECDSFNSFDTNRFEELKILISLANKEKSILNTQYIELVDNFERMLQEHISKIRIQCDPCVKNIKVSTFNGIKVRTDRQVLMDKISILDNNIECYQTEYNKYKQIIEEIRIKVCKALMDQLKELELECPFCKNIDIPVDIIHNFKEENEHGFLKKSTCFSCVNKCCNYCKKTKKIKFYDDHMGDLHHVNLSLINCIDKIIEPYNNYFIEIFDVSLNFFSCSHCSFNCSSLADFYIHNVNFCKYDECNCDESDLH